MGKKKIIILVAVNGSQSTELGSHIPLSPEDIAKETAKCAGAGASIVHIHARDPKTGLASADPAVFSEIIRQIRRETDILVQTTTGIGQQRDPVTGEVKWPSAEQRLGLLGIEPAQDMVTVPLGSWDFIHPAGNQPDSRIYLNPPDFIKANIERMKKSKFTWEMEIGEVGFLYNALRLSEQGVFDRNDPSFWLDYLLGYGAMPANARQLMFISEEGKRLFPQARWEVNATGLNMFPMNTIGVGLGCDIVRVGFEDNIFLPDGHQAKHNYELVEAMASIIRYMGQEVANTKDAREIMRVKK